MQEFRDSSRLNWNFFRDERHVHTHRVTLLPAVYCLVHGKIFDQEHAHVRARRNWHRNRITCNQREYGTHTTHVPVAFSRR